MAKSFAVKKQVTVFTLQDPLTFGKCKGATLEVVIKQDPPYIRWCMNNIPWFKIDNEAEIVLHVHEARYDEHDKFATRYSEYPEYPGDYGF
jgi:hypothetical protein